MYRILYVDDEPDLLEVSKDFLEESGLFSVDTITSAKAALALMENTVFDAIISDYQMPGMDGIRFLQQVRAAGNAIPFILFTGRGREDVVIQAINEGANFYLQKGGDPEPQFAELGHKLQVAIEHHHGAEKIESLNRLYSVLSETNKAVFHIRSKSEFFSRICRILVENGGFSMAWIGLSDPQQRKIHPVASAGHVDGYLDTIDISTEDVPRGRGPTGTAYRTGQYYCCNDIAKDPRMEPWRENALRRGYRANASFPFGQGTHNPGIINIYAPVPGFFNAMVISLLNELAVDVSFALSTIDAEEERKRSEIAVRESERKFSTVFRSSPVALTLVSVADGKFVDVNDAFVKNSGHLRDDVIGVAAKDLGIFVDENDPIRMAAALKDQQSFYEREMLCRKKDGGIRTCRFASSIILMGGKPHILSTIEDVTDQHAAEDALRRSETRLRRAEEIGRSGNWEIQLDTGTVSASDGARILYGLPGSQWTLKQVQEIPLPEDRPRLDAALRDLIAGRAPYTIEFRIQRLSDGEVRDIHSVAEYDAERKTVMGVIRDITLRKQAERALQQSEARYKVISEMTTDFVFSCSDKGGGFFTNDWMAGAMETITGYTPEELQTIGCWRYLVEPDDLPQFDEYVTGIPPGDSRTCTLRIRTKSGHIRWLSVSTTHLLPERGTAISQLIGSCTEITEKKETEDALRVSEQRFREQYQNNPLAIFIWQFRDGDFVLADFNRAAKNLSGGRSENFLGQKASMLYATRPDILDEIHTAFSDRAVISKDLVSEHFLPGKFIHTTASYVAPDLIMIHMEDISGRKTAEAALRESQEKLTEAMDLAHIANWEYAVGTDIFTFDDRFYSLYGTTAEREGGYHMSSETYAREFVHPDDRHMVGEEVKRSLETIDPHYTAYLEHRILRRDGDVRHIVVRIGITKDAQGRTIRTHGANQDITERKKTEDALREREIQLGLAMDVSHLVNWELDIASGLFTFDERFYSLYNTTAEREGGTRMPAETYLREFVHPEDAPFIASQIKKTLDGVPLTTPQIEHRIICRNGQVRFIVVRFWNYPDEHGRVVKIFGANQDITDRIRAEEVLRESEQKFRSLVEYALEGILILDFNGSVLFANNAASRMVEVNDRASLIGRNVMEFIAPESREAVIHDFVQVSQGKDAYLASYSAISARGTRFFVEGIGKMINYEGKPADLLSVRDITERRRAEENLQKTNKKLSLLSGITRHDINNQLTKLMAYLRLLEKKLPDPSHKEYFDKVSGAAQTISSMIQFTREYESIGIQAPVWQDCRVLVDTAAKETHLGNVMVKNDIPSGVQILADPLIVKVWYNLMDNAVRYGGRITTIRFFIRQDNGDQIIVCEDDGEGIPADEKEKIFENRFGRNTGLGLALSREILDITGITILETGEPGVGARFEISVPEHMWQNTGHNDIGEDT